MAELRMTWAFAGNSSAGSTFTGDAIMIPHQALEHAFYVQISSGAATSATVDIYTGRSTSSPGTSIVGGSINFTTSATAQEAIVQMSGVLAAVWPKVVISSGSAISTLGIDLISVGAGGL